MSLDPKDPPVVPIPVHIETPVPIPVVHVGGNVNVKDGGPNVQSEIIDPSKPATTTFEQNLTTASQRNINLIWETTQMKVALSVIWVSLMVAASLAVLGKFLGSPDIQLAAVVFLFGVANLVTGFYFGRTNHTKSGGIGDRQSSR